MKVSLMNIKNLVLTLDNFTKGGPAILQSVAPDYEYNADHKRTDKIIGLRVNVIFPCNSYDFQVIRVADPTDRLSALLSKATPASPVYVEFDGFSGSIYTMRGEDGRWRPGVSAKASAVRVVPGPDEKIDFGPEVD